MFMSQASVGNLSEDFSIVDRICLHFRPSHFEAGIGGVAGRRAACSLPGTKEERAPAKTTVPAQAMTVLQPSVVPLPRAALPIEESRALVGEVAPAVRGDFYS